MKITFKQNVGMFDRMLRVCLGLALIALGFLFVKETISTVLIILSIPLLFAGITGYCPTYTLLGISTKRDASCC
jgi:DUF2892 family protein